MLLQQPPIREIFRTQTDAAGADDNVNCLFVNRMFGIKQTGKIRITVCIETIFVMITKKMNVDHGQI